MVPPMDGPFLHQHHLVAVVGKIERRLDSRHPATNDQRLLDEGQPFRFERLELAHPRHGHPGEIEGFAVAEARVRSCAPNCNVPGYWPFPADKD